MFDSIIGAMLAHKHALIAGIAVAVVATYMFAPMIPAAQAQRPPIVIQREITIPCQPYCNNLPNQPPFSTGIHRDVDNIVHIDITFSFAPRV